MAKKNKETEESPIKKVLFSAVNDIVIYPYSLTPLVFNGKKRDLVEKASNEDRMIALFPNLTKDNLDVKGDLGLEKIAEAAPQLEDEKQIGPVGVLARIVKILKFPDGTVRALVRGLKRVSFVQQVDMDHVIVQQVETIVNDKVEVAAMARNALEQFKMIMRLSNNFPEELKIAILNIRDNIRLTDMISESLNMSFLEKVALLTISDLGERLQLLTILLNKEVEVLQLGSAIQKQVHDAMGKTQREFFLREQLKVIKKELGEDEKTNSDVIDIRKRMENIEFPEEVLEVLEKEIERLTVIPEAAGEYHVIYSYIDWLLSLPWNKFSEDRLDIVEAEKILNKDHYGLEDVKDRILDFLAVLQLKKNKKSPILCFVGPPGVGKTSLGKSIAKAMGREFARMSLGGVRDEAEIRGHRKTYLGSMPGKIIRNMKKAGTNNPIIMLDEIDKLGNDHKGDPASALLEVLDPQQNSSFNDHYLDVDYDLSSVMFIATANTTDYIPAPLLDRMEVIRISGYTTMEKKQIAKRYLLPRQLKENGVLQRQLSVGLPVIEDVINFYTREAGVRLLEQTLGKVCRKVARSIVSNEQDPSDKLVLKSKQLSRYLGKKRFSMKEATYFDGIGVAVGMAWTSVGGTILPVEVSMMPGKGGLKLTGSLGKVMQESAETAFTLIKSQAKKLKIKPAVFAENDFHIHVPDGATPKDGPSAGVTISVALTSLLKQVKPKKLTSMTGEITLRGKVTPIGGVKEKVIAALQAGIKNVMLPKRNENDLDDIPEEIRKKLNIKFVDDIHEALKFMEI